MARAGATANVLPRANLDAGEARCPPCRGRRAFASPADGWFPLASKVPEDLRYSTEHEWLKVEGAKGRVGITDYAQNQLTDVVYVKLPSVGTHVKKGDGLGEVESIKSVSPIYSPVTGKVVEVNKALEAAPEAMNRDPYGQGWFAVLQLDNPAEGKDLLDAKKYRAHIGE
jgi:glycine cleavage system H protein